MITEETSEQADLSARLLDGAKKALENAEQLYQEARILREAKAIARSLCLHQISLEECAKVDSLGAWVTSLFLGFEVDHRKVFSALSRHAAKNKTNAYMLDVPLPEAEAIAAGDLDTARQAFKQLQEQFHQSSNEAKNASLYVDWVDGKFAAPAERISEEMLSEICDRNESFLRYAGVNLRAMNNLMANSATLREPMLELVRNIEELRRHTPGDYAERLDTLLNEFFTRARAAST